MKLKNYNKFYFEYGRTALKFGLISANIQKASSILIPEFICDAIIQPLEEIGLNIKFYKIEKNFSPSIRSIQEQIDSSVKTLMIVHYFGFFQNLDRIKKICEENSLLLVEDSSHGYGYVENAEKENKLGDIIFSSPRKSFNIPFGGALYLKKKYKIKLNIKYRKNFFLHYYKWFIKHKIKNILETNNDFNKLIRFQPKYWDDTLWDEAHIENNCLNQFIIQKINKESLVKNSLLRRQEFKFWEDFILKKDSLEPVYKSLEKNSIPLCYPVITKNYDETKFWYNWGWKNGIDIRSWPNLPKEIKYKKGKPYKRWQRFLWIPIYGRKNLSKLDYHINKNIMDI
tara:strand:- start:87 stop:1109 length:1023 start_codon:yes stop_codon:yes gene_type:complete